MPDHLAIVFLSAVGGVVFSAVAMLFAWYRRRRLRRQDAEREPLRRALAEYHSLGSFSMLIPDLPEHEFRRIRDRSRELEKTIRELDPKIASMVLEQA